jgi:hypothetical protein
MLFLVSIFLCSFEAEIPVLDVVIQPVKSFRAIGGYAQDGDED